MDMPSRKDFASDKARMDALVAAYHANFSAKGTADFADLDERFGFWDAASSKKNTGYYTFGILVDAKVHTPGKAPKAVPAPKPEPKPEPKSAPNNDCGHEHPEYQTLLTLIKTKIKVMLVGPTGSGKTTACSKIAKQLGLTFLPQSFCNQTPESRFAGFVAAGGQYVESGFYHVFKHGGLYLFDEMDAANANVLTAFNAGVENRVYTFPNGETVEAHESFRAVGAANTFGTGASLDYQRNKLDAATLKRFLKLAWGYNEAHELRISPRADWTRHVQKARRAAERIGLRIIVSPHDSIYGGQALNAGLSWGKVEEMTFLAGVDAASVAKLRAAMKAA
jgi:hypothetical protein